MPDFIGLLERLLGGLLALLGIGAVVLLWLKVVRTSLLSRRYGDATLELKQAPSNLGGRLEGRVLVNAPLAIDEAVNVSFQCWSNRSDGGDSGGSTQQLRWDCETLFSVDQIAQGTGVLSLPIYLAIPAELPPTGPGEGGWEVVWTLKASFEPDIGYRPTFDVLVTSGRGGVPASARPDKLASHRKIVSGQNEAQGLESGIQASGRPSTRPPHARTRIDPAPEGGIEVTPRRRVSSPILAGWCLLTLPLWVVLPYWSLVELKNVESPPLVAYLIQLGIAFGVALLLNGLPLLAVAFENRGLRLGSDGVAARRWLRRKRFPAGYFTYAEAVGNSDSKWLISLERSPTAFLGGMGVTVVSTEAEARWLVGELGLALDTSGPLVLRIV